MEGHIQGMSDETAETLGKVQYCLAAGKARDTGQSLKGRDIWPRCLDFVL